MNLAFIIQLLCGAAGGNFAGALSERISQGPLTNSILGIVGGAVGGFILNQLGIGSDPGTTSEMASLIPNILGGAAGGGTLLAVWGLVKNAFSRSTSNS